MGVQADDGWVCDGAGVCQGIMPMLWIPPDTFGELNGVAGLCWPGCEVAGFGAVMSDIVATVFVDCWVFSEGIVQTSIGTNVNCF